MLRIVTKPDCIPVVTDVGALLASSGSQLMSPALLSRDDRKFASEIKYWIPAELAPGIQDWARQHLSPDAHGRGPHSDSYHTTSLYLDTPAFDVLDRAGSYGRSKYRIRRYGFSPTAFVERKLKAGSLVSKRRTAIAIEELDRLGSTRIERGSPAFWFHRRISRRTLQPVCQIAYLRM